MTLRTRFGLAIAIAALGAAACDTGKSVAPPQMSAGLTGGDALGELKVCKFGLAGVFYDFTISGSPPDVGQYVVGNSFSIEGSQCRTVWAAASPNDPTVTLTVAEVGDIPTSILVVGGLSSSTTATSASVDLNFENFAAIKFHDPETPPFPGKTFSIGPSSMEGAIRISNGDWVNGGYSFKFKNNTHVATTFTVAATVSITGPCIGGGPATFTGVLTLPTRSYTVPAGNTAWLPTGDANSVLSWQGSTIASVCDGIGQLDARHGAVFTATVWQDPPTGSLVDFRFKYRDPAAKGKPNTNCLDTTDPNRNKADVCGASWSQTVTDP